MHPNATKEGYVLEHRAVVERELGRLLTADEVVHHIDEDKHNNDPKNLTVMSKGDHMRLHHAGRTYLEFVCPVCGKIFLKEKRQCKRGVDFPKCSRSCNGKASRALQLLKEGE